MPSSHSLLSESLFGEALARSDIAAFLIRDDAIIAANEAASRLTGYAPDELLTVSLDELSGSRDAAEKEEKQRRRKAAERGEWQSGLGRVVRKDGKSQAIRYLGGATAVGSTATLLALAWEPHAVQDDAAATGALGKWFTGRRQSPAEGSGGETEPTHGGGTRRLVRARRA
jgi:PAS domain S-box-containing protein